ncbi:MAG TPA: hypothetical protein VMU33_16335 [Burkholderiaceae bacterium]|nr:hypothetical protein [Burkholderiaceae bacterium]
MSRNAIRASRSSAYAVSVAVAFALGLAGTLASAGAVADDGSMTTAGAHGSLEKLTTDGKLNGGWGVRGAAVKYTGADCDSDLILDLLRPGHGRENVKAHIWWAHIEDLHVGHDELVFTYKKGTPLHLTTDDASAPAMIEAAQFLQKACIGK